MEIKDRIAKIITSEGLTQSEFAESIGTANATITHILSGRNGASLDILTKILNAFPQYNTDWLLFGKGDIYKKPVQTTIFDVLGEPEPVAELTAQLSQQLVNQDNETENKDVKQAVSQKLNAQSDAIQPEQQKTPIVQPQPSEIPHFEKKPAIKQPDVKQVIVLYTDGTFSVYNKSIS